MFNLCSDTRHEAGIIIYKDESVAVYNWADCGDNQIPVLSPLGTPTVWPLEASSDITHVASVDDVREYLPGTAWNEEGEIKLDLDIVYDANMDIPALFGCGPAASLYEAIEQPYSGNIWSLPDGTQAITVDWWN